MLSDQAKFRKLETNMLNRVHTFSGLNQEQIRDIFYSLIYEIMVDYRNGKKSIIPSLGTLEIIYRGDELRKDGLVDAKVEIKFEPCQDVIRSIGQIVDEEESDIERRQFHKFLNTISEHLHIKNNIEEEKS